MLVSQNHNVEVTYWQKCEYKMAIQDDGKVLKLMVDGVGYKHALPERVAPSSPSQYRRILWTSECSGQR